MIDECFHCKRIFREEQLTIVTVISYETAKHKEYEDRLYCYLCFDENEFNEEIDGCEIVSTTSLPW